MSRSLGMLMAASAAQIVAGQGLHDLAVAAGLDFFGTASEVNNFDDEQYLSVLAEPGEYGMLVPENSQKWESIQPTEGEFDFVDADLVLDRATTNGQQFRCHTLTWHSQLPDFVENGVWTRETLTALIQTHIANTMGHFQGSCHSWDVVNEALEDDGTFRQSVFFETLGTDFIPISFAAAAEADPDARLWYNDFSLEFNSPKTDGAVEIVELVQEAGVRIDGVGFQAHMIVGSTPSQDDLTTVLERFTSLGMEVAFTELDIRHESLPADAAAVEQQAQDYVTMVKTCLDVAQCVGVLVWQFTDKYSWIPSTFPGEGDACLLDEDFNPKPAYTSVSELLAASATGAPAGGATSAAVVPGGAAGAVPTDAVDFPANEQWQEDEVDYCEDDDMPAEPAVTSAVPEFPSPPGGEGAVAGGNGTIPGEEQPVEAAGVATKFELGVVMVVGVLTSAFIVG